jgi:hypothetical protein
VAQPGRDDVGIQVAALGEGLLQHADELADAMVERIQAAVAVYHAGAISTGQLRQTCLDNVQFILGPLGRTPALSSPESRENGRLRAKAGVPLTAVMEAYRVGARYLWERLAQEATRKAVPAAVTLQAASEMWLVLDTFTQAMADGYRDEMTAQIVGQEQQRSALVEALLEGRFADTSIWETAELLRLPPKGHYVVVAALVPGIGLHALPNVESALKTIGIPSAWRLQHDVEVGIACLPRPRTQLDELVTALERICVGRVGVSTPYDDLTATASGLRLARIALHTAFDRQPVCVFGRDLLATAVASSPDIMKRVADTVLASLTKIPATDRAMLLETFGTWLDSHGSATETAEKMFVHPNTVRHRLRRLEERTGRSLTDPRGVAELGIAFEIDRRNDTPTSTTGPS